MKDYKKISEFYYVAGKLYGLLNYIETVDELPKNTIKKLKECLADIHVNSYANEAKEKDYER